MKKSILVIGMGNFGRYLTKRLTDFDVDVMIVDSDAKKVEAMSSFVTNAHIGDCTNIDVLESLDIPSFDVCFVAIGDNFQASLEITSLLSELGAKHVVSKAHRDIQEKFLRKNGANEVVYPEKDLANRLAVTYSSNNLFDFIHISDDYSIFEIPILRNWANKSIMSLNLRSKFNINILAVKNNGTLYPSPSPDYMFKADDHIVVLGKQEEVIKLANKIN